MRAQLRWSGSIAVAVIGMAVALALPSWTAKARLQSGEDNRTPQPNAEAEPQLRLGEFDRGSGTTASIPIIFAAAKENIGFVRAELIVPTGPWAFRRARAPQDSWWKVSFKAKRNQKIKDSKKGEERVTLVELRISSSKRDLQDGLLAHLEFQIESADAPAPSGITIRSVETSAAAPDPVPLESVTPDIPGLPPEAPMGPLQSCFFFSH